MELLLQSFLPPSPPGSRWRRVVSLTRRPFYLCKRGTFARLIGRLVDYRAGIAVAYPGIFFRGWGVQQIQLRTEERDNGDLGGGSPLVRGYGGSCNLVQEISFRIVKFS